MPNKLVYGEILECGHCHNQGRFDTKTHFIDRQKAASDVRVFHILLECPVCKKATYIISFVRISDEEFMEATFQGHIPGGEEIKRIVRFPKAKKHLTNLPPDVKEVYEQVLKQRDYDANACAMHVGRTLEAVCNHENIPGVTLNDKLNNLLKTERIPKPLAEMAHQLRQVRNLGAHIADIKITEDDIPVIIEFLEAILEYLYIAPAKIEALKERLKPTAP